MPTWGELAQQFGELAPPLRRYRIFYVWGGDDITELRGDRYEPERHRFEALAQIAGLKLSEIPRTELVPAVMARPPGRARWYEALRWHSEMFHESGGAQSVVAGVLQPRNFSGYVPNPADVSATLALHFSTMEPPPIRELTWRERFGTWRRSVVGVVIFWSALVVLIASGWQIFRWIRNTPEGGQTAVHLPSTVTSAPAPQSVTASLPSPPAPTSAPANSVGKVYSNSGIIAPGATGQIIQQRGQQRPPPRFMSQKQIDAATAELRKARGGNVARINYSADNDVDEIETFYDQVVRLVQNSGRWEVVTEHIGRSMSFADRGTLTGEGVRCTSSSEYGDMAIEAMRLSGFRCIGKARDWAVSEANKAGTDVVISIGSRFVPPE